MDPADIGFMIICSGLVMFMIPGLACFYGGLVQNRNVLSTSMHSLIMLGVGSVLWAVIGYSLVFGNDVGGIIGGLSYTFLSGVGLEPTNAESKIPHLLFMGFQCMFACITPALISGAYAERMKFWAMLLFSTLFLLVIYFPLAHWVWGGGWMASIGVLDFAGGAVVHISSAAAALACIHVLGPRLGLKNGETSPHNLPLTVLGTGLLWFGWFGFNAGSALAANGVAVNAMTTTHLAASAGILGWLLVERMHFGKPTTFGAVSGAIAGLATITPAAGFVTPIVGMLIGFTGGVVCYSAVLLKSRLGYDDALDVIGIHGVGGTLGMLALGLFATLSVNSAGADGLFLGNPKQFFVQLLCVVVTWIYCYMMARGILFVVQRVTRVRADEAEEIRGMDLSEHNERGYQL